MRWLSYLKGGLVEGRIHDYAELPDQKKEKLHGRREEPREAGVQGHE